jgi:hypothetical protein
VVRTYYDRAKWRHLSFVALFSGSPLSMSAQELQRFLSTHGTFTPRDQPRRRGTVVVKVLPTSVQNELRS